MNNAHESQARDYLTRVLGPRGFTNLKYVAGFDENPLVGEGPVSIFAFEAVHDSGNPEPCHVVAGQTEPNYYPTWGLAPEDVFNLHIGTRFMLVVQVAQKPFEQVPFDPGETAKTLLSGVAPGQPLRDVRPVAVFGVEDQTHVVARARIGPEEVYLIFGDIPLGIYRRLDLPPHAVYRMHLGQVIRMEKTDEPE